MFWLEEAHSMATDEIDPRPTVEVERLNAITECTHVHIRYDDGGAYEVPCECLCGERA